ncbi:MAG: hypothetical protein IRZ16_22830 [Myxococcaceae bacterium]|nr:hypothetical protein [Myxococcaceae bacterium]
MTPYSVVVFLHVVSATGLVAALALEGVTLARLGTAPTVEVARDRAGGFAAMPWVGIPSMVLILLTGGYLATTWGWKPEWIRIAIPALLMFPLLGGTLTRKGITAIQQTLAAPRESNAGPGKLGSLQLWLSWGIRVGTLVGVVFLMEVKPALAVAVTAMAIAVAMGAALAFLPLPGKEAR